MEQRSSGILLHITSLPTPFGIGDLGPAAYRCADFLSMAGQKYWQVLPLAYTHQSHGNSPYSCISAFAGNPLLISPDLLVEDGLLSAADRAAAAGVTSGKVDYAKAIEVKTGLLAIAFDNFKKKGEDPEYAEFCRSNRHWLEDFALFIALRAQHKGTLWNEWPKEIAGRDPAALRSMKKLFALQIDREKFFQYLFFRQWFRLKNYCAERKIGFVGDIPIYVNCDSADVWVHPEFFKLDRRGAPAYRAGVPPDYFSENGQLWGNPVYNWDRLKEDRYSWWADRLAMNFQMYDLVRIDHFRGFVAYWEVPAGEKTAVNGVWAPGPGYDFFDSMHRRFRKLPIIAEDLGTITPDVRELIDHYGFPGMKVLLFAFGGDFPESTYLPHHYDGSGVVYTGTHDNNTVRGWFENEATPESRVNLERYAGRTATADNVSEIFIRMAISSCARIAVIPLQDVLGLGSAARMNTPSTMDHNWQWQMTGNELSDELAGKLRGVCELYGRSKKLKIAEK